jgi:hypothetical protein
MAHNLQHDRKSLLCLQRLQIEKLANNGFE